MHYGISYIPQLQQAFPHSKVILRLHFMDTHGRLKVLHSLIERHLIDIGTGNFIVELTVIAVKMRCFFIIKPCLGVIFKPVITMSYSFVNHIFGPGQLNYLLKRFNSIPVFAQPYIGVSHIPVSIIKFLIDNQCIPVGINRFFKQLQPLERRP